MPDDEHVSPLTLQIDIWQRLARVEAYVDEITKSVGRAEEGRNEIIRRLAVLEDHWSRADAVAKAGSALVRVVYVLAAGILSFLGWVAHSFFGPGKHPG